MAAIEAQAPEQFRDYLKATANTICGRHPIAVLLQARGPPGSGLAHGGGGGQA